VVTGVEGKYDVETKHPISVKERKVNGLLSIINKQLSNVLSRVPN